MNIDPKREYLPSEIAENGFILSGIGKKSLRHIQRLIQHGKLKAKEYPIAKNLKIYKVKGKDILHYQKQFAQN